MKERIEIHKDLRQERGLPPSTYNYGDPDPAMGRDPLFTAIWNEIGTWDINVPYAYDGYMGANGNHVAAIIRAIRPVIEEIERRAATNTVVTLKIDTDAIVKDIERRLTAAPSRSPFQDHWFGPPHTIGGSIQGTPADVFNSVDGTS